ncbi:MAG TPA: pilus assembly protein PilM [Myxococcaceae bacterium]|nr:pilus assembly protein PilM [Myxococcaceae bacterium]
MARILGLDLGSWSFKALLHDTSQKASSARTFVEVPLPQNVEDPEAARRAALARLIELVPGGVPDLTVISLPGPSLATHPINLPFSDPKRIEATLPFEIEGVLPVDLDAVFYDYQPMGAPGPRGNELLVGVVRREELISLLSMLQEQGIDPRVVTHPAVALQNLYTQTPPLLEVGDDPAGLVAVVDIGHRRTNVAVGIPGQGLLGARTFAAGGFDVTRAVCNELQLDPEDAEELKHAQGTFDASAVRADARRVHEAMVRGLQPLLRELRPTLRAMSTRAQRPIRRLYLCGGSAEAAAIDTYLSRELGMPVERLPTGGDLARTRGLEPDHAISAGQVHALVLRGTAPTARSPRFNFRRGPLAFKGDFDFLKDRVGLLVAFAATLLLLFVFSGLVRNSLLRREEAKVDAALCALTQRTLGTCEKDYARALNLMAGQESPISSIPKQTATQLLAEVVAALPDGPDITLDRVEVGLDRISLRGTTSSRAAVDDMSAALEKHRCFPQVEPGRVETTRDNRTSFGLEIQVACDAAEAAPQG